MGPEIQYRADKLTFGSVSLMLNDTESDEHCCEINVPSSMESGLISKRKSV